MMGKSLRRKTDTTRKAKYNRVHYLEINMREINEACDAFLRKSKVPTNYYEELQRKREIKERSNRLN